jgi:hypothetical protein
MCRTIFAGLFACLLLASIVFHGYHQKTKTGSDQLDPQTEIFRIVHWQNIRGEFANSTPESRCSTFPTGSGR